MCFIWNLNNRVLNKCPAHREKKWATRAHENLICASAYQFDMRLRIRNWPALAHTKMTCACAYQSYLSLRRSIPKFSAIAHTKNFCHCGYQKLLAMRIRNRRVPWGYLSTFICVYIQLTFAFLHEVYLIYSSLMLLDSWKCLSYNTVLHLHFSLITK